MIIWRDYQLEALDATFEAWEVYNRILGVAATGAGKAQPLDAHILTPDGWHEMGSIKVGTLVIGEDGKPHPVIGVFPQGIKDIYRVHFDDGAVVECCADHLWKVQTKSDKNRGRGYKVLALKDIVARGIIDGAGQNKWFIPVVKPVELERKAMHYNENPKQGRTKAIVRVEPAGRKECQCIAVGSKDQTYITDGYTVTHNTNLIWGTVDRHLQQVKPNARSLIVAHRSELIKQPKRRAKEFFPHLANKVGIVMGKESQPNKQIIIGTIQTVGGKSGKRLQRILQYGKIDLLIIDEAHHAEAAQYYNLYLKLLAANPDLKVLGVTATPERGDRKLLTRIFQFEAYNIGIKRLIDAGHLCRPVFKGVSTRIDLSKVASSGNGGKRDYREKDLVAAVETANVFDLVIKTHLAECGDLPTLAFVVSVAGAKRLAEMFCRVGVRAKAVYGEMSDADRVDALSGFENGKYTCLVNVGVLTEGTDLPLTRCIHMVRPTRSDPLYIQMVGRGLRLWPGKEFLLVLDYAPMPERSFEQRMKLDAPIKRKIMRKQVTGDRVTQPKPQSTGETETILLDYFARKPVAWLVDPDGWRCIQLGRGIDERTNKPIERGLALSPDGLTLWAIYRYCRDPQTGQMGDRWETAKILAQGDAQKNLSLIDLYAAKHGKKALLNPQAPWRSNPPPEWLIEKGRKRGVYEEGMTHGALSDALNRITIMSAVKRSAEKVYQ